MSTPAHVQTPYSPAHYLAQERLAACKSEYINGEIYAMAGASKQHNQITFNIAGELRNQLKGRSCEAYVNDLRVKVDATGLYTYPDVVALCGTAEFEDSHTDTLLNPTVIMEVLSSSTEAYDRGDKFAHYRRLPSLQDYVLISQHRVRVEHLIRQTDYEWLLHLHESLDDVLSLRSLACQIPLREIYDKVVFTEQT